MDLNRGSAFGTKCLYLSKQLLWYASRLYPLDQPCFADSVVGFLDIETDQAKDSSASPGRVDLFLEKDECLLR